MRTSLEAGKWHIRTKSEKYRPSRASRANLDTILRYDTVLATSNRKEQTRINMVGTIHNLAEFLGEKPFMEATVEDIMGFISNRQDASNKVKPGSGIKERTVEVTKIRVKNFYGWLFGGRIGYHADKKFPECVSWMTVNRRAGDRLSVENLLTADEITSMIRCAYDMRDKAIISVLYETGCRVGEFKEIRLKDIRQDRFGAVIHVDGKTGPRDVRVVNSMPYLKEWLKVHPFKDNPESYLWQNLSRSPTGASTRAGGHRCLKYGGITRILKHVALRAGVTKRVYAHLLRHSRATHLAAKIPESTLRKVFGWSDGSNMVSTYVHLNDASVDTTLLSKVYGVRQEDLKKLGTSNLEAVTEALMPKVCVNCKEPNAVDFDYCQRCSFPLDMKAAEKRERDFVSMITPDMVEKMIQKKVEELLLKEPNI